MFYTLVSNKFYITTAIPYVNARPHIGHALEFVQADVIARYHRQKGGEVLLLSGSDDNALKNVQAAEAAGMPVAEFIVQNAKAFLDLAQKLNVHFDIFQHGSDQKRHFPSSRELWRRCADAGDIYKKSYEGLYCLGCEAFYGPDELNENGECLEHPGKKLEKVAEENYFFRLSKYWDRVRDLIASGELRIVPESRKNEVLASLEREPLDLSVSRSNERAKNWGVPVPGDDFQRIYVWFDALNIYQSGVGFGWDEEQYKKWWPADVHVIGKGIIRFHAVYWPAFLLSAGLPLPKSLFVHGYITSDGQKMSKTLGNVIDPFELVERYGADPVRYYFLREIPSTGDGDFSREKFSARYNGDLANGLGNLVARVTTLATRVRSSEFGVRSFVESKKLKEMIEETKKEYERALADFQFHEALVAVWNLIHAADRYINEEKPWEHEKSEVISDLLFVITELTALLEPFLPESAEKIREQVSLRNGAFAIKKSGVLFPRIG